MSKRDKENNAALSALLAPIEQLVGHFKNWKILHTDRSRCDGVPEDHLLEDGSLGALTMEAGPNGR